MVQESKVRLDRATMVCIQILHQLMMARVLNKLYLLFQLITDLLDNHLQCLAIDRLAITTINNLSLLI